MKTRTTKLTVTPGELFHKMGFEVEIVDEATGEFVEVLSNADGTLLRIDPSQWPFLRDAIDRMFVEIAENEKGEGKQAEPAKTSELTASEAGWIPWEGGECPVSGDKRVLVRLRDGYESAASPAHVWQWGLMAEYPEADIIAYKVVD